MSQSESILPAPPAWAIWRFGWFWPALIISLLGINAAVCLVTLAVATGDPSMAIEPDYHQQAISWDQDAARQRASEALGWTCEPKISAPLSPLGERRLSLQVRDRAGAPISEGQVALTYFHHARASERAEATVPALAGEAGRYEAVLPLRRPGTWELRLTIQRAESTFVSRQLVSVD